MYKVRVSDRIFHFPKDTKPRWIPLPPQAKNLCALRHAIQSTRGFETCLEKPQKKRSNEETKNEEVDFNATNLKAENETERPTGF